MNYRNNCFVVFWFWSSENMHNPTTRYLRQSHIICMILKIINTVNSQGACNSLHDRCKVLDFFLSFVVSKSTHLSLRTINGCESSINIIWSSLFEVKRTHMRTSLVETSHMLVSFPLDLYWDFEPDFSSDLY